MEWKISNILKTSIKELFWVELEEIQLKTPPKKEMWDFAFGCFVLAKDLKKSPMVIAQEIADNIWWLDLIEDASVDGPYINIKISKNNYTDIFNDLYINKEELLSSNIWENKKIIIDYIGANVWKVLHIGHMCTPNIW